MSIKRHFKRSVYWLLVVLATTLVFINNASADELSESKQSSGEQLTGEQLTGEQWAKTCNDWDEWDKSGPPFIIHENSYYVGTCGITAILITSDIGHILIDGATEQGAAVIANNIELLGFKLDDVKILLHSHEHFDHVGGLAALKKLSGAKLIASKPAQEVLETGILSKLDPQFGTHKPFAPVLVDDVVLDGQTVRLGDLELTAMVTPGHSPGALSWQWQSCKQENCLSIVYADSLSPISRKLYRFTKQTDYLAAYKQGVQKISNTNCQILLAPHPSAANLRRKLQSKSGLLNEKSCKQYGKKVSSNIKKRLIKERQMDDAN